MAFRSGRIMVG